MDGRNHNGWQDYLSQLVKEQLIYAETLSNNNTKSVPQIFISQKYVGGADDLADIYKDGRLVDLLKQSIP